MFTEIIALSLQSLNNELIIHRKVKLKES